MELDAYLARIAYRGGLAPDLATLSSIVGRQAEAIPFEAIDVLLGKSIDIDLAAVCDKLIAQRRGGYCFEQNGLLQSALTALGFSVTARLARVLWMRPAEAVPAQATHMALVVRIAGRDYLVDAGFGNGTPTAPLAFDTAEAQATPLETFRLRASGDGHVLDMRTGGNWSPVYEILAGTAAPGDLAKANLFTSTHPDSRFRRDLMLARATTDARFLLLGNRLMTRPARGNAEVRSLDGPEALGDAFRTVFGLDVRPEWSGLHARFAPATRPAPEPHA